MTLNCINSPAYDTKILEEARSKDESFLCLPIAARQFLPPAGQSENCSTREDSLDCELVPTQKKEKGANLLTSCGITQV